MNPIETITLTHANLKQPMELARQLIAGYYHSPGHKCTHVVASGGAVFPALESVEEVRRLFMGQAAPTEPHEAATDNAVTKE